MGWLSDILNHRSLLREYREQERITADVLDDMDVPRATYMAGRRYELKLYGRLRWLKSQKFQGPVLPACIEVQRSADR